MAEQLLLSIPPVTQTGPYCRRLDRHTREIGLKGVADARRILADLARAAEEREAVLPDAA